MMSILSAALSSVIRSLSLNALLLSMNRHTHKKIVLMANERIPDIDWMNIWLTFLKADPRQDLTRSSLSGFNKSDKNEEYPVFRLTR